MGNFQSIQENPVIILASASPRRRMLMRQAGIPCEILPCDVDEIVTETISPYDMVQIISARKAVHALELTTVPAVIVAADTVVCVDGQVLGKPRDEREAFTMLKTLQGRCHTVYTGVTLMQTGNGISDRQPTGGVSTGHAEQLSFTEKADVFMRPLTDREIDAYIATGEPMDKAGAYGVQEKGSLLIERVEGDFYTVVGLPLVKLALALSNWGLDVPGFWRAGGSSI